MNHIYKVIWSRVKNSYVVVSEIAGKARKSGRVRVSKNTLAAVLAAFLLTGISVSPVSAALDGVNTFVEAGNQNIKIGNDIDLRNNSTKNGAIAIGDHAQIDDYVMQEGSIAIGKNAFVENMYGMQENNFKFGQSNEKKWASSVAIGQNSYARSGSVMIGDHKYIGKLGDVEVDGSDVQKVKSRNVNINATTVGANSYNQGAFSTISGTYSIISGKYDGSNWSSHVGQNFGATVMGSLNSVESATSSSMYSGVANSIVGTANRTHNANGTLVFGAGNEVTNSVDNIANPMSFLGINSPKELAEKLREDIRRNDSGGAVLAVGGGNKADYAYRSQLVGVGNTLTGTAAEKAAYNLLNGYKNTGTNVSGVTVIGTNRTISNAKDTIVMGSSAGGITTTASKAVILGSEANAEKDGGVALGADSVASVDKGAAGYDPSTDTASANTSAAWKATHAAVSVGNGSTATRQITGVAAGTNDTDAVNVAQLKAIAGGTGSIHFVSVKGGNASSVNYNNDGAKETGAIAIGANAEATASSAVAMGFNAQSNGSGSIVIGESSGLIPDASKRGASKGNSSIIIGTENVDKGGTKDHAGSNDGILGSNNTIQESNGAFVTGAFNHVSDSYQFGQLSASEQQELAQAMMDGKPLGKYIGKWGSHVFVTGDGNTVSQGMNVTISGSQNTVENSKSQTVIGDSNKITGRNAGTISGKQEERTKNVSDLVIGKGNDISGNSTYMEGYESLTVIGNNNEMVNPGAGIVIGDNQKVGAIKESVVIGSMTPEEKADSDIQQKHASVVVGYHAQSGTRDGGGMNVALGHGAKAYGWQETVTGIKSIVEAGDSGLDGYLASVYGGLNTVASNKAYQSDGMANTVVGTLNKTEGANGALVFGAGNSVTHSFGTAPTDENGNSMNEYWGDIISFEGQGYAGGTGQSGHDELRKAMGLAMSTGGGSVVTMGNGNTADYAVHSQIIGSGNILTGTANTPSINNTINGYGNTGRNVERMSMMGTGNNISDGTADVVIGDYHHMDGGKNNVILGSMATEKKTVTKTYTRKDASGNVIREKKYKVTENVPIKSHTANISNAVMLGYNTDVEKDGGVAIGADSVASVDKGAAGYDPSTDTASTDTSATWKATAAAVSIGKAATPTSAAVTRQITNVAAGTQDTDAVNVAQLKKVQAAAGAAKVHYYSAKSTKTGAGSNYDNDGAEAEDSIVLGISSSSKGVNSTVLGNNNKLTGVKNGRNNSIVAGQNLDVEGVHNAVFGTDYNNYDHKLTKVFGEQNTVIGVGNLVGYTAEKDPSDPTKWIYTKNSSGSDQNVAVGMKNTVNGASVVVGADSEAEGIGASFGRGNKVIGPDNGGGYRGLALGNNLTVKGEEAVAVGTNASATADWAIAMGSESKAEKENAMAFGYASHAKVVGGVALGAWSVADRAGGVSGYDPSTKAASTDTSATWKATAAAVSVGDSTGNTKITRQITNVAAGSEDTDAVNVAQLKKVEAKAAEAEKKHTTVKAGDYVTVTEDTNGDGGKEYTISGPKMESTDGTVKITDKVENGKKVGYNLSVNTSSLGIEKTEVTAGENVTVTSKKDGNKTTYTINAKDTVVTGGTASYAADGKGTATLTNNDGSTATITGLRDLYTSSAALDGNTLNFTRNDGSTYSVSGIASTKDIWNITNKVDKLGTRVNKVGAGAAALAALHPLDFDPDDKWDIAAGYGNYKDAHAVAVGAFYRPNEDLMFSVGGSFGGGENMVNAGVSLKLGQGNHVSTSKVAMAKEIVDLRDENKDLKKRLDTMEQKMNSILGILDMGKKKDFPDVPENHWAYEYVATLAGNGIIEGYPDGMFSGDRSMTRYEFAAMFYRALKNGAPVDSNMDRAMNEFEPELRQIRLDRIRVDRISGKDNDRNKVERVRVNNEDDMANNDYRDVYGSHISPEA